MAKEKNKTELPQVMEGELQARLIKLREDAGYDMPQMAAVLCLSEEVIKNLENEAFDLLPEPPYVRGYLRNYAKLGDDDDASELINRYEALRGANANELDFQIKTSGNIKNSTQKRISPVWGQVLILVIIIGAIALLSTIPAVNNWFTEKWGSFSSQLTPSNAENNPSLLGSLPVPAPLPVDEAKILAEKAINAESATNSQKSTETTSNDSADIAQSVLAENESATEGDSSKETTTETSSIASLNKDTTNDVDIELTEQNTEDATTTSDSQAITTSSNELINIQLTFNKEVWLRIKDKDNKTVFEGLNKAGTEKKVDLKKPLTFRVGNAQGLSLSIDNKPVDISSYINGSIANFTLE